MNDKESNDWNRFEADEESSASQQRRFQSTMEPLASMAPPLRHSRAISEDGSVGDGVSLVDDYNPSDLIAAWAEDGDMTAEMTRNERAESLDLTYADTVYSYEAGNFRGDSLSTMEKYNQAGMTESIGTADLHYQNSVYSYDMQSANLSNMEKNKSKDKIRESLSSLGNEGEVEVEASSHMFDVESSIDNQSEKQDDLSVLNKYNPDGLVESWTAPTEDDMEQGIQQTTSKQPLRRHRRLIALSAIVLLIAVVVIAVVVAVQSKENNGDTPTTPIIGPPSTTSPVTSAPSIAPPGTNLPTTAPPTVQPTEPTTMPPTSPVASEVLNVLVAASFDSGLALEDQNSPQYKAFLWLASDPNLAILTEEEQIQRFVLGTVYYSTLGPTSWTGGEWLSFSDECEWPEITCENGEVTEIVLSNKGLGGTLPPELGLLSNLVHLDFEGNNISGVIPQEISVPGTLEHINLAGNSLSGPIPQGLGAGLVFLNLQFNSLNGSIPDDFGSSMKTLNLIGNQLEGSIPSSLYSLTELVNLSLARNLLEGSILGDIEDLQDLEVLDLSSNKLYGEVPFQIRTKANPTGVSSKR